MAILRVALPTPSHDSDPDDERRSAPLRIILFRCDFFGEAEILTELGDKRQEMHGTRRSSDADDVRAIGGEDFEDAGARGVGIKYSRRKRSREIDSRSHASIEGRQISRRRSKHSVRRSCARVGDKQVNDHPRPARRTRSNGFGRRRNG